MSSFHDTPGLPRAYNDDDGFDYIVGDRVFVDGNKSGAVAYVGEVKFAVGDWAGVVLEEPTGKHNGTVNGTEYFQCEPLHGLFVRMHRLSRHPTTPKASSTPVPTTTTTSSTSRGVRYNPTPITEPLSGRSSSASSANQQRRSALKSPSRSSNTNLHGGTNGDQDEDLNPSNWYKQNAIDQSNETPHHIPRSMSRDSYRSTSSLSNNKFYNDKSFRDCSPDPLDNDDSKHSTVIHKISSSRTPTPTSASPAPLRRQKSAMINRPYFGNRETSSSQQHLLTPKTKNVADAYVPTYRRAPTSDSPLRLGTRVVVNSNQGILTGILRYVGCTQFASGDWAGVELDEPVGKNDGSMLGRRYFICPKNFGIFVPIHKVSKEYMPNSSGQDRLYNRSPSRDVRSHSSLSKQDIVPKTKRTIRRPIFTSTCAPIITTKTETTTEPKTVTTNITTTRTRTIPIETTSPPLRRYRSSLSRLASDGDDIDRDFDRGFSRDLDWDIKKDFDRAFKSKVFDNDLDEDFDKDFTIARLAPMSPALDKYYSSSKKNSSSYSSRLVDYSDMY